LGAREDNERLAIVTTATLATEAEVGEFSWPLPFTPASAPAARSRVTDVLRSFDVEPATVDNARLVVSELLGNALRHGRARASGDVLLTMVVDPEAVSIEVADGGGHTLPTLVHAPLMSLGGRGLRIVHTVSRDWGVREAVGGKTVFAVVPRT
jgi:anti-sigma regulatory factor (Ser/Thr protein kinase)